MQHGRGPENRYKRPEAEEEKTTWKRSNASKQLEAEDESVDRVHMLFNIHTFQ